MNFIVILLDSLRRDHLGAYGELGVRTPSIDAFARRAAVFDGARIASHPCLPHRRDVWTGRYAFPWRGWDGLLSTERDFVELVRKNGHVAAFVTDNIHLVSGIGNFHRNFSGFELVRGQEDDPWITDPRIPLRFPCAKYKLRNPDTSFAQYLRNTWHRRSERDWFVPQVVEKACDWLDANRTLKDFFLWVDCYDPHEPYDPPFPFNEMYDPGYKGEEVIYPKYGWASYLTDAELHHVQALYKGEVSFVDKWVGRLLEKIEELGLLRDTCILVTSDHGKMIGEHGLMGLPWAALSDSNLYEELARIPWIFWDPRGHGQGKRFGCLVQPVDLFPTILDAMGIEVPAGCHGRSFLPVLEGRKEKIRDLCFYGRGNEGVYVTDGRYTLFYWGRESGRTALYDLAEDPRQRGNLVDEAPGVFGSLEDEVRGFLHTIAAPPETFSRVGLEAHEGRRVVV